MSSIGTELLKASSANGEWSRASGSIPISFSSWIMSTVCCCASMVLRCRINAVKAFLSASRAFFEKGVMISSDRPALLVERGKRCSPVFIQAGT